MNQNSRLVHVSNLSVLNFRIFAARVGRYPGLVREPAGASLSPRNAGVTGSRQLSRHIWLTEDLPNGPARPGRAQAATDTTHGAEAVPRIVTSREHVQGTGDDKGHSGFLESHARGTVISSRPSLPGKLPAVHTTFQVDSCIIPYSRNCSLAHVHMMTHTVGIHV